MGLGTKKKKNLKNRKKGKKERKGLTYFERQNQAKQSG